MPIDQQDYRELVRQVAYEQAKLSTSAFFFDGNDRLRLRTFGSVASVIVAIEGRMLTVDGNVQAFADVHAPASDRTEATTLYRIGEGFLLNVSLRASTGTPRRGQVFGILEVVRGLGATVVPLAVLFADYITDTQRVGWPGSLVRGSTEGPGVLRSITGTDPAANVEITETVPANARWRPLAITFTLVTDANAANREVALTFDDGTTVFARVPSGFTHAASLTVIYSTYHHAPRFTVAQDTAKNFPLPRIDLQGGFRVNTVTTARQATDNFGAPQMLVEEWIED
jgi:hypothetical protein